MAVLSQDIGRMDVLFHRGADESIGIQWKQNNRDGKEFVPVDLRPWTCTFEMYTGNTLVYSKGCTTTSNGHARCDIPGSAFTAPAWDIRLDGTWRILGAGPNGERELLGHGYYRLVI